MENKLTKVELKNTTKVTSSNVVSKFGDVLFDYVNSVFLSGSANGGLWLALYQSSEVVISTFFNFWGGALSDYGNRKRIIWQCDIISGLICLILGILIPKPFFIYAILAINVALAVLTSFRNPAYKAVFREIVYKEHISKVNSILEIAKQTIQICGPTISLVVAHFLGSRAALIVDGLSFIVSGLLISRLEILTPVRKEKVKKKTWSQIREGLIYIYGNKDILLIILFSSVVNFIIAGYDLILPFATYAFPSTKVKAYALFLTAEAVGGLIGAAVSTFIKKEATTNKLLVLILLSGGALLPSAALYAITNSVGVVAICVALFNLCISVYNIQFMSFVQVRTDINYIGRVFGIIFSVAILFVPFGTFFFKFVFNLKNGNDYMLIGLILIIVTVVTLLLNAVTIRRS